MRDSGTLEDEDILGDMGLNSKRPQRPLVH